MGFVRAGAETALVEAGGDPQRAVELLLAAQQTPPAREREPEPGPEFVPAVVCGTVREHEVRLG